MLGRIFIHTYKQAKRAIIIIVGFTMLLFGVALIALPGPAFIVIPAGLAILATEFLWARRLLKQVKQRTLGMAAYLGWNSGNAPQRGTRSESGSDAGALPADKRDNNAKKKKQGKKPRKGNKADDKGQEGLS